MMMLSDFDYHLPDDLIAQVPLADRSASRMMVVDRATGRLEDRSFKDLPSYLGAGDCLALNDTRVFAARLFGAKPGYERQVEIFLLRAEDKERKFWTALVRPGRHLHEGTRVEISPTLRAQVLETRVRGERLIHLECDGDLDAELRSAGHVPLPPYIHRADETTDQERYQTVYAEQPGSVAAPTAGLHFTPDVLAACQTAGADIAKLTLHIGLGTFQPLQNPEVEANHLHTEAFAITAEAAAKLAAARRRIAVGTTAVRTLETAALRGGLIEQSGETDMFIYPGHQFKAVDAMLTNFHLPKSSLLLLVSAFAGRDLILHAYQHAADQRYRFFSYGDCMLIL